MIVTNSNIMVCVYGAVCSNPATRPLLHKSNLRMCTCDMSQLSATVVQSVATTLWVRVDV